MISFITSRTAIHDAGEALLLFLLCTFGKPWYLPCSQHNYVPISIQLHVLHS